MSLRFDGRAFAALLLLTAVEALIATVGKPYPWLRGFVGDVLAVGWVYLVFRSFIRAGVLPLAVAALLTGYAVEFGQYLAKLYGWQIKQPLLRILLGSVPDWWDVLAYTVGFFLVLALAGWRRRGARARRRLGGVRMPAAVFAGLHTSAAPAPAAWSAPARAGFRCPAGSRSCRGVHASP